MRILTNFLVIVSSLLVAVPTTAQPTDGDLVVVRMGTTTVPDCLLVWDQAKSRWSTLYAGTTNEYVGCVKMAPDNAGLLMNRGPRSGGQQMLYVSVPSGRTRTLGATPSSVEAFSLDHDGTIIAAGVRGTGHLWSMSFATPTSLALTTLAVSPNQLFNALAIDRRTSPSNGSPYYVAAWPYGSTAKPCVLRITRHGIQTTFAANLGGALRNLTGIEVDPVTGGLLACASHGDIHLISPSGKKATHLHKAPSRCDWVRIGQDLTVWVCCTGGKPCVLKMDLNGTVSTMIPVPPNIHPVGAAVGCLEIYGSRRIVCNGTGKPGTTVKVNVQSRKAGDGGKAYALACSFNRRPPAPSTCLKFPNGEYLFLDQFGPLFWTSFLGITPSVFQSFKGVLDAKGNATAQVNIPSTFPPNLGITIFVAGVIYDSTGVRTVTNTHWFVL